MLSSLSEDKEVYAHLHVEGTNIDYPVAQHPSADRQKREAAVQRSVFRWLNYFRSDC